MTLLKGHGKQLEEEESRQGRRRAGAGPGQSRQRQGPAHAVPETPPRRNHRHVIRQRKEEEKGLTNHGRQ